MNKEIETSSDATERKEAFAENTLLTKLLGDNPRAKILSALLSESDRDVNVTEIANLTGMSRSTVYRHLKPLEKLDVVEHTRDVGGSPMYRINRESPAAQDIAHLNWDLMDVFAEE